MNERTLNPFPGVNPYVEVEGYWEDFHGRLVTTLSEELLDRLPPRYDARIEQRTLVLLPESTEQRRPDVVVTERPGPAPSVAQPQPAVGVASGPVAVLEMLPLDLREEREVWIEVIDMDHEAVVTSVEVLPPSNKDSRGNDAFNTKRANRLFGGINLVEVDLLLGGERLRFRQPLPEGHYYSFLTRAGRRPRAAEVRAWTVRDAVPPIAVPLRAPDPDVVIDLGRAYVNAYERGHYPRRVRYRRPPPATFSPADRAWVDERVASLRDGAR